MRDRRRPRAAGDFPRIDPEYERADAKLVVHVDGGARGNPGPAAAAAVSPSRTARWSTRPPRCSGRRRTTSPSTAGCCSACARARELGATEVEVVNDSELVARAGRRRVQGQARGHEAAAREAMALLGGFEAWSIRSVPRAQNARADELVNAALDAA